VTDWKLVRDNVPAIMVRKGIVASTDDPMFRRVDGAEYRNLLWKKLHEELGEFANAGDVEEAADVLEVLTALFVDIDADRTVSVLHGVEAVATAKRAVRGGFFAGWAWAYDPEIAKTNTGFLDDPVG
jgi:predicted house-cleaning noncanonical NTP pyrophosphatase (MazG superfamily)